LPERISDILPSRPYLHFLQILTANVFLIMLCAPVRLDQLGGHHFFGAIGRRLIMQDHRAGKCGGMLSRWFATTPEGGICANSNTAMSSVS